MLFLQITSAVTAVAIVVLVLCLLPVLQELKRAAVSLRTIAETMQGEVKPLLKELHETIADIQVVTGSAASHADEVNVLLEELGHAGRNIRMINKVMGVASTLVAGSSTWVTGARVAGRYIADRLMKKRG